KQLVYPLMAALLKFRTRKIHIGNVGSAIRNLLLLFCNLLLLFCLLLCRIRCLSLLLCNLRLLLSLSLLLFCLTRSLLSIFFRFVSNLLLLFCSLLCRIRPLSLLLCNLRLLLSVFFCCISTYLGVLCLGAQLESQPGQPGHHRQQHDHCHQQPALPANQPLLTCQLPLCFRALLSFHFQLPLCFGLLLHFGIARSPIKDWGSQNIVEVFVAQHVRLVERRGDRSQDACVARRQFFEQRIELCGSESAVIGQIRSGIRDLRAGGGDEVAEDARCYVTIFFVHLVHCFVEGSLDNVLRAFQFI